MDKIDYTGCYWLAGFFIIAGAIMWAWNCFCGGLLHLHKLTYPQALAAYVLLYLLGHLIRRAKGG